MIFGKNVLVIIFQTDLHIIIIIITILFDYLIIIKYNYYKCVLQ